MALTKESLEDLLRSAGATIEELSSALGGAATTPQPATPADPAALAEAHRQRLMALYMAIPPMPAPVPNAETSDLQVRATADMQAVINGQAMLMELGGLLADVLRHWLGPITAGGGIGAAATANAAGALAGAVARAKAFLASTCGEGDAACPMTVALGKAAAVTSLLGRLGK